MTARPVEQIGERSALRAARETVLTEASGLTVLANALEGALGDGIERAVALILALKGRVIVTGMGKSGHVGAKVAATLASTGTPAFFVHPAEASHGDLGMVTADDVILALSWSGETVELKNLLLYSRRFRVPLIAVTAGAESTLAQMAEVALVLPKVEEACPHGLAPTTSALLQLALCDALAVSLLKERGFTALDFKAFHPGGSLGAALQHVGDAMHEATAMPLAAMGTAMSQAVLTMSEKGFGCVGVVDPAGRLAGIITDGDLRRHMGERLLELTVDEVMTPNPKTVSRETLLVTALEMLNAASITALFAVDEGRPVGIVHLHDLLRAGVA